MANLVIVESPSKATTIKSYLGSGYKVIASVGHVRDLPKSTLGIDLDNDFEAHYINIRGKGDLIKELKKEAKSATKVFLATDPDREGEAISWHLATVLGIPIEKTKRITFNEVTKTAIKDAIKKPRAIDMELVNSQQARRLLDRIVGYKLSPFLWKSVRGGLSAGRVQSVATRIIVEREREIEAFIPKEYWTITANHKNADGVPFTSKFYGTTKNKIELNSAEDVTAIQKATESNDFVIDSIKKSVRHKNPQAPFTTSSLLQDSARKLGFQSQKTMKVAQELYEGINLGSENGGVRGLITYMRTDSLRISQEASEAAKDYIISHYGENYYPSAPRQYKTKGDAQDAHEAIRPSDVTLEPARIRKSLSNDQYKLYKLVWERFVASQMQAAEYDTVAVNILCGDYLFKSAGQTLRFRGYLSVYSDITKDEEDAAITLPALSEKEMLVGTTITPNQHFTEPPARYSEAALIDFFKEKGIGRPSTYAQIITTIISRGYVKRDAKVLVPTQLGSVTTDLMLEYFPDIVNYQFTAQMENDLDSVSSGSNTMTGVLSKFYDKFKIDLENALSSVGEGKVSLAAETTDLTCEKCGATMIVKSGRFGKFAACPNYPTCKNTRSLTDETKPETTEKKEPEATDLTCEKCGAPMVTRHGKYGKFFACSAFPKCRHIVSADNQIDVPCPICGKEIITKRAKGKTIFYSCSGYPDCQFSSWDKPTKELCPSCGKNLFVKKGKDIAVCCNKDCERHDKGAGEQ